MVYKKVIDLEKIYIIYNFKKHKAKLIRKEKK